MHIAECEQVVVDMGLRAVGKLRPTGADIDAVLFQPPEQRNGVRDVEQVIGRFRAHLAVIEFEHAVMRSQFQQE